MRYLLLVLALLICGCENDRDQMLKKPEEAESSPTLGDDIDLETQHIAFVKYDHLGEWLRGHKRIEIVSITSVDRGGHGITSSFIVVYRKGA